MRTGVYWIKENSETVYRVLMDAADIRRAESSGAESAVPEQVYCVLEYTGIAVFDIELPAPLKGDELSSMLIFELERRMPLPMDEICWGYCRRRSAMKTLTVFAMRRSLYSAIMERVENEKLRFDCMLATGVIPEIAESGSDVDLPAWKNIKIDCGGIAVPASGDLLPKRNRLLKSAYRLLLASVLMLVLLSFGQRFVAYADAEAAISKAAQAAVGELTLQQRKNSSLQAESAFYEKLKDAKWGIESPGPMIQELTAKLPHSMWISQYSQSGHTVDLVVVSDKDDHNFFRNLSASDAYQVLSLRKTRSGDSKMLFYVKLRSLI